MMRPRKRSKMPPLWPRWASPAAIASSENPPWRAPISIRSQALGE